MDGAWVSCAMIDERLYGLLIEADIVEHDLARAGDAIWRNNIGEALTPDWFPTAAWRSADASGNLATLPDLFPAGGYWVVSAAVAETMDGFDLGQGALYPLQVFRKDRRTPMPGGYRCLNFGNVKRAFRGEQSRAAPSGYDEGIWKLPTSRPRDGDLAVSREALVGADIWVDPALVRAFFISDRLASALKAANLDKPFSLRKCRLV